MQSKVKKNIYFFKKFFKKALIFLNISIPGYPERLDMKPVGPRDPPGHFQRKQEYL